MLVINMFTIISISCLLALLLPSLCETCPLGWVNFNSTKCYKYVAVNVNYADADRYCSDLNATLASLHSAEEQDFVLSLGRAHYTLSGVHWVWLGAVRNSSDSHEQFYWKDGSNFSDFSDWREGCPDRRVGENCVLLTVFRDRPSHWCNFKCDTNYDHVLCQRPYTNDTSPLARPATAGLPGRTRVSPWTGRLRPRVRTTSPPSTGTSTSTSAPGTPLQQPVYATATAPCPLTWQVYADKCYKFSHENVTGELAAFYCKRQFGGQLLAIRDEGEQLFAVEFAFDINAAKDAVWLAGRRNGSGTGDFVWRQADGSGNLPMDSYVNWAPHEPDNREGTEECVAMNDVHEFWGRWLDAPCSARFHVICTLDARQVPGAPSDSDESPGVVDTEYRDDDSGRPPVTAMRSDGSARLEKGATSTTVLVWLLLVTLSLFVLTLLIVVYSQRQKLRTIIGESRLNIYYKSAGRGGSRAGGGLGGGQFRNQRDSDSDVTRLEPEYAEPSMATGHYANSGLVSDHLNSSSLQTHGQGQGQRGGGGGFRSNFKDNASLI